MALKHCLVDGGLAVVENYHFHRDSRRGHRATGTHEHIVAPGVGTGPFDVFHRIGAAADIAAEGGAAVAVGSPAEVHIGGVGLVHIQVEVVGRIPEKTYREWHVAHGAAQAADSRRRANGPDISLPVVGNIIPDFIRALHVGHFGTERGRQFDCFYKIVLGEFLGCLLQRGLIGVHVAVVVDNHVNFAAIGRKAAGRHE